MRRKAGFTYVELVVALCIFAVLTAIAVPATVRISRQIMIKSLNDRARAVFMAAYCRVDRGSPPLHGKTAFDGRTYIKFGDGSELETLVELTTDCDSVIIEYVNTPVSVTGVYLSDKLSPDELEEAFIGGKIRDQKSANQMKVGYYGGLTEPFPPTNVFDFRPTVKIVNGEELIATVSCENLPDGTAADFDVELILTCGDHSETLNLGDFGALMVDSNHLEISVVLDAPPGLGIPFAVRFPELCGGEAIASAKIIYKKSPFGESSADEIKDSEVVFEPLFESRSGENITVSKVRHINNLRYLSGNFNVRQTADIGFKNVPEKEFLDGFSHDLSILPIPNFTGNFDGNGYLIKNFTLKEQSGTAALFESVSGVIQNLHLVGKSEISTEKADLVGGICGRLEADGVLENCSVSGLDVTAPDGSNFGGIAAICDGIITNCSAVLGEISLGKSCKAGGIAGISSGKIELSHSSGRFVAGEDGLICGISGGGTVERCYSECCAGSISGSDFYGISDLPTSGSQYLVGNAWLAKDLENAVRSGELSVEGFERALLTETDGEFKPGGELPESVSFRGIPTRFGEVSTPLPRGLIGLMKVTFDGADFVTEVLQCFDAYGNDSQLHPEAKWQNPAENEAKYYVFWSEEAAPEGGDEGYEFTFSESLGDLQKDNFFNYQEIVAPDKVALRFGDVTREAEIGSAEEEEKAGVVGVFTSFKNKVGILPAQFRNACGYLSSDIENYVEFRSQLGALSDTNNPSGVIPYFIDFTFETSSNRQLRIYIFESAGLEIGTDWSCTGDLMDGMGSYFEAEGFKIYEIFVGDSISESVLTVNFGDKKLKVMVEPPKNKYGDFNFQFSDS